MKITPSLRGFTRLRAGRFAAGISIALLSWSVWSAHPAGAAAADTEGGSTEVKAQPGCLNQWLFNGMWRVRVTKVVFHPPDTDQTFNSWDVTMQWRNGTPFAGLYPTDTNAQDLVLGFKSGDTLAATATSDGNLDEQKLFFHHFPASGQYTFTQHFISPDPLDQNDPPAKLLVAFDVAAYKKAQGSTGKYWTMKTPAYDYRIDLSCDKGAPSS